jgi:hypothetical protein
LKQIIVSLSLFLPAAPDQRRPRAPEFFGVRAVELVG